MYLIKFKVSIVFIFNYIFKNMMLICRNLFFLDFWGKDNGYNGMVNVCVNSIVCYRYNEWYCFEYV